MMNVFIVKLFFTQASILIFLCGVGLINNATNNNYRDKIHNIILGIVMIGCCGMIGTFLYGLWGM